MLVVSISRSTTPFGKGCSTLNFWCSNQQQQQELYFYSTDFTFPIQFLILPFTWIWTPWMRLIVRNTFNLAMVHHTSCSFFLRPFCHKPSFQIQKMMLNGSIIVVCINAAVESHQKILSALPHLSKHCSCQLFPKVWHSAPESNHIAYHCLYPLSFWIQEELQQYSCGRR